MAPSANITPRTHREPKLRDNELNLDGGHDSFAGVVIQTSCDQWMESLLLLLIGIILVQKSLSD